MKTIKIYLLEKRKNGRNRYLISTYNFLPLYFEFFNGTFKQARERTKYIIENKLNGVVAN